MTSFANLISIAANCELLPQNQSLVGKMRQLFVGLTDYHYKASIVAVNLQ
jgi:hypothetical protein